MKNMIPVSEQLPPSNTYVLGRHNLDNWHDSDDQAGVQFVVVKLVEGISQSTREKMLSREIEDPMVGEPEVISEELGLGTDGKRSSLYTSGDEHGNNTVPYAWDTFGPTSFFGQEITHWQRLPHN